jgi:hypothetical protein
MAEVIKIDGWAEFSKNLRKMDSDLPKMLRLVANESAGIVVDWAKPRVPTDSGRAARSLKSKSTRTEARVQGGSKSAPHYAWLEFGGGVGPKKSVKRPFIKEGRYIYAGLAANNESVHMVLLGGFLDVARAAGIEVET